MSRRPGRLRTELAVPYAAGCATLAVVTLARIALTPVLGGSVSLLPFTLPVVVAALLGGVLPAVVLTAASLSTADWFLMEPVYSMSISDPDEVSRMLMFIIVGVGIAWLGERQVRAVRQLRAAKEEAEAANAAKDEFLMVVSHELRTPMTSLLGWVQMLKMGHIDPQDVPGAVDRIHESAVAEIEIIENILDVARLAVGKFVTRREKVNVSNIAEAALAQFHARAAERAITLEGSIPPQQIVSGDHDRLRQVVNNLLSNALKFTESGGSVKLALSSDDGRVRIEVIDSGIGIASDFLPHVFDRFRQADEARSRRYGGLGLGLAIAKHLVDAHGGTIHAESDGPGKGARFVVELPALPSE